MKISKLIAAAAVTAVTMTAAAAAANAETTTVSDPDTGKTTVKIDFADMAKVYSEYLNNGSVGDGGVEGSLLKYADTYVGYTFGELPGYYGFYPNLAVGNVNDYIIDSKIRIGGKKGLASNQTSVDVNGNKLSAGRYLKFVPEYDCELHVSAKPGDNRGWAIEGVDNASTTSTGITELTANCVAGNTYYVKSNNKTLEISALSYTYDTPVIPSAEVTSLTKLNDKTFTDEKGGQADAYTFTVTGKNGKVSAKSIIFNIGDTPQTEDVSLTLDEGSTAVYGLIVNSKDSSEALPEVTQDMITIE